MRVLAGIAAAALLALAWRAIPSSPHALGIPVGAPRRLGAEIILGYTRSLVPLTAALFLSWYAWADIAMRALRFRIALSTSCATLAVVSVLGFAISTAGAFASGSNLGPIAGMVTVVVAAPSAIFVGALVGIIVSRFTHGRIVEP